MITRVRDVKKIAIFRALTLGDIIFSLPALHAIHRAYPRAEITYLGRDWLSGFLPGRAPGVHRVVEVPYPRGADVELGRVIPPADEPGFVQQMQVEGFDLALQMQGGGKQSNRFVGQFGARVTAGARAPDAPALDRWIPYTYYQSEVHRMLDIAALVGAPPDPHNLHPRVPVLPTDLAAAAPFLEQVTRPYLLLHPGSTDPRRRWSPEKFAETAAHYQQAHDMAVVITGVDYEAQIAADIASRLPGEVHNLCCLLSLPALVGVLSGARLVLSNDTGPLHLALAVGTPSVGLFWCEYVVNSLPLSRARFLPLISWERACPNCGLVIDKKEADSPQESGCSHLVSFVDSITTEQACAAIDHLFNI
jgi:ADP-heptose:LPS heptosyltransferase